MENEWLKYLVKRDNSIISMHLFLVFILYE